VNNKYCNKLRQLLQPHICLREHSVQTPSDEWDLHFAGNLYPTTLQTSIYHQ